MMRGRPSISRSRPDADAALLKKAHGMAMQCAGAVAGEPRYFPSAFEPDLFGADLPREVNFQNAVQRLDELETRLRAAERSAAAGNRIAELRAEQPFAEREGQTIFTERAAARPLRHAPHGSDHRADDPRSRRR